MRVTTEALGVGRSVCVEPAGGAGRGGSWVLFGRSQRQPSFAPRQQEREEMEGTKKKKKELWGNGVTGERAALGTPHHRCSAAAA